MLLIGHIPIAITLAVPRVQAYCPTAVNCLQYDLYTFNTDSDYAAIINKIIIYFI